MYGAIMTEPVHRDSDVGVLFMHNEGWSTMCGHGIIALSTVATETAFVAARENLKIDTPAGSIAAHARLRNGTDQVHYVESVAFENVPSFVYA
jgi:trans-L-3-hydroxyproline dehydratase